MSNSILTHLAAAGERRCGASCGETQRRLTPSLSSFSIMRHCLSCSCCARMQVTRCPTRWLVSMQTNGPSSRPPLVRVPCFRQTFDLNPKPLPFPCFCRHRRPAHACRVRPQGMCHADITVTMKVSSMVLQVGDNVRVRLSAIDTAKEFVTAVEVD